MEEMLRQAMGQRVFGREVDALNEIIHDNEFHWCYLIFIIRIVSIQKCA